MLKAVDLPRQWRMPLLAIGLLACSCVLAFLPTWSSIVAIWSRSETFAHGFLVVPISLWLIWIRRDQYRDLSPEFSGLALLATLICGFGWLVAHLVHVLVIQQWAAVGILISSFWALLGNRVAQHILFPLLFLFLMVPFGEEFIPTLMEYTASFVVLMLRLTGMSVYREGLFFTLTSGTWSVVEGCSGLRYLIASFTLGTVFAYLNYTSYKKRAIFILASFLTPILANGLRAYMIVMIGHLSSMKLATGVDHIIYGWVFFGLVMLLLFYVGSFWQDPLPSSAKAALTENSVSGRSYKNLWPMLLLSGVALAIWPILAANLLARQAIQVEIPVSMAPPFQQWQATNAVDWGWEPNFHGVVVDKSQYVSDGQSTVGLYFANFGDESQGGELVNSQNYLVPQKHKVWRVIHNANTSLTLGDGKAFVAEESVLSSKTRDLFVLRWYRVGQINTANAYRAKFFQLIKRLTGDASAELLIVLYTETPHGQYQQARETLQKIAAVCCS